MLSLSTIRESRGSDVFMPGKTAILPGTGSGLIPQLAPYTLNNPMGGFVRPWDLGHSSVTEVTWGDQVHDSPLDLLFSWQHSPVCRC